MFIYYKLETLRSRHGHDCHPHTDVQARRRGTQGRGWRQREDRVLHHGQEPPDERGRRHGAPDDGLQGGGGAGRLHREGGHNDGSFPRLRRRKVGGKS